MTTTMRPKGLRGWSFRCASAVLALAFCASAFAGADGNAVQPSKTQTAVQHRKLCYAFSVVSGIPVPCDRLVGAITTTTSPMDVIGRAPSK